MWAQKLVNNPLVKSEFRPIGFMAVTKVLISIKNSEFTLRLFPYLSSIFAIFLTYFIAREIFKSKVTILLSMFLVSFNPILISFAKEFKPYSVEFSVHLLIILILLLYIKRKIHLTPCHIMGILLIAFPFAYNIVFLYPSVFLLLLLEAYQGKKTGKFIALICIVCAGLVGFLLLFTGVFSGSTIQSSAIYWGKKYNVFYLSGGLTNHIKWIVNKYFGLVLNSGRLEVFWNFIPVKYPAQQFRWFSVTGIIDTTLVTAHCIGFAYLILKKKTEILLLFVLPVFVVILFNVLGIWPFGPFRVNLFLFCYFLIISLYGIDAVINSSNTRFNQCMTVPIVIILIFLQLPFKPEYYESKKHIPDSDMKYVLNTILKMDHMDLLGHVKNQKRLIMADEHSFHQIKYYLKNHTEFSNKNRDIFAADYKIFKVRRMRELNTRGYVNNIKPVWIINSNIRDINNADKYLIRDNIIFKKIFKKNQNELIYYLPHTVSNIITFDQKNGFEGIRGLSNMDLKREMRHGREVLVARSSGRNSFLEFQEIKYPKDRFLSISAHIESPAWTDLRIFYMTESDKQYSESKSVTIWIEYGQNTLNAVINDKNIYGKILMSPGKVPGKYVISEISIYSVGGVLTKSSIKE